MPSTDTGSAVLGFGLLTVLSTALIVLLVRLVFLTEEQSTARRVVRVAVISIAVLAYCCIVYALGADDTELIAYALWIAMLYIGVGLFSLWFIYALQGWMKIPAVLMALLAAIVAGWNLFAAAFLGSS